MSVQHKLQVSGEVIEIPVSQIHRGPNRGRFNETANIDHVQSLAKSIAENGQQQNCGVRRYPAGQNGPQGQPFDLVWGWTRTAAIEMLKGPTGTVRCIVVDADDTGALVAAVDENEKRTDKNAMDQAIAHKRLSDAGWTGQDIASHFQITGARVSQLKTLLTLPEAAQKAIADGQLTAAAGIALASLKNVLPASGGECAKRQLELLTGNFKPMDQAKADETLQQKEQYDSGAIIRKVAAIVKAKTEGEKTEEQKAEEKKAEEEKKAAEGKTGNGQPAAVAVAPGEVPGQKAGPVESANLPATVLLRVLDELLAPKDVAQAMSDFLDPVRLFLKGQVAPDQLRERIVKQAGRWERIVTELENAKKKTGNGK